MEVATTNNHSHHLQADGGGGVGSSGSRSPFQREVREWQRIDPQTGALFSGRLEADRWINGPLNSYGKISDSQNISQPNGTQHTQRKQLEVLQARTANGAMQVIRTQTVQKTSSTSRWSSTSTSTTTRTANSSSNGWAQFKLKSRPSQSVDICELSDGDGDGDDDYDDDADAAGSSLSGSESTSMLRHDHKKELVDDHVDFVVINGQSSDQDDDGVTDDVAHLHKLGHNLLPDTAPSLKLSNLMKSSSSISSQSSNNSNLTTATATAATMSTTAANTHRSAGKISLHAIVEPASASASASSSAWPKQADLYGQSNRRVGVPAAEAGAGAGADVVVGTPTQRRRDLESFRHDNGNEADDDLRLSARHQRRQQVSQSVYAPPLTPIATSLQRSRSISTDDLSNEWDRRSNNDNDIENEEHPGEWRRVSKLRRSFQSQDHYKTPTPAVRSRPLDLPSNSVSVARMRAELENRRRLHTAMRNNHVDLAALDTILNSATPKPTVAKRNTFLTAESLQEIRGKLKKLSDESLYKEDFLAYQARKQSKEDIQPQTSAFRPVAHNTHSLESRQRQKDTNSSEWHLRRKSYGFEKMAPPEDKSIFRVDASTDSGLGRSGEQLGNWSPTERERERAASAVNNGNGSGTIIHFSRQLKPGSPQPSEGELSKRHSIAVEETWRDIRKTSQVHVNGENITSSSTSSTSHLQRNSAQKRVEFCKTEVHFAAESGRVNIVETDGKPPPTQNFRRRRRTASGPLQSLVKAASASPSNTSGTDVVTHFGDDSQRRKTIVTSTVAYRATLMEPPEVVSNQPSNNSTQVTVTIPKPIALETRRFSQMESTSRNSYTSTSGVDTTDNETDELANIRGILKNKPVKPKPYHLGENIESADVLWSVPPSIKSDRESPAGKESATIGESPVTTKSVAERIRIVEQRQHDQQQSSPAGNGYSTKINVSLGVEDNCPNDSGQRQEAHRRRPSVQELMLEDLRTHQRILDEGLKSTSLIMKTMRSASEFDEAMRRLSIASIESALIQPTIIVPRPMIRSHSYQEDTRTSSSLSSCRTSTTSIASSDLFGSALYDSLPRTPLTPPRLKLLGNTQIPVSQQLTQLRRLYDAADQQDEDSADEEVKRYFRDIDSGGGTQSSSSPEPPMPYHSEDVNLIKGTEYSNSWSRMKAKRTVWKVEAQGQMLRRTDLPKSNVMNIALHSPRVEMPKVTPPTLRIGQLVPVAKPRTLFIQPQPQPQTQHHSQITENNDESGSESLKIVKEARGARKLREHELSYFGVQQQQQPKVLSTSNVHMNPRRSLPSRSRVSQSDDVSTTTTTKWQLLNDRPDLLRHSPQGANDNDNHDSNNIDDDDENDGEQEHCYENIANELTTTFRVKPPSPSNSYERKSDLQRDAQILSEMTHNADQTMKALSDEAAIKDQRRRRSCSLQRRQGKPLETIDEKVKIYNSDRQHSSSVTRGTFASEARRNSRQSTPSPTPRARSSSQSSIECCPRARSRSSSRESMTQGGASSDDQTSKPRVERLRMRTPKREKLRQDQVTEHRSRHSSKQKSSASALPESTRRIHHHSRHRSGEQEHSGEGKNSSSTRLMRSSRVSDENRPRSSTHRISDRERERERSRVSTEKHREELTRSRGHSSRSRHTEEQLTKRESASRPIKSRSSRGSHDTTTTTTTTTSSAHKKPTTSNSKSTSHKVSSTPTTTTTTTAPTAHNELTHGKSTLNGHHHHPHHHQQSSSKHRAGHGGPSHHPEHQHHHVHSLTTTTIAASKQQRDRHGKDRK